MVQEGGGTRGWEHTKAGQGGGSIVGGRGYRRTGVQEGGGKNLMSRGRGYMSAGVYYCTRGCEYRRAEVQDPVVCYMGGESGRAPLSSSSSFFHIILCAGGGVIVEMDSPQTNNTFYVTVTK